MLYILCGYHIVNYEWNPEKVYIRNFTLTCLKSSEKCKFKEPKMNDEIFGYTSEKK